MKLTNAEIKKFLEWVQIAIAAAPTVIAIVEKAREFISAMFGAGLISIEQQNALHTFVGECQAAALNGQPPPHWVVEPDPEP
jgi:hypothetical protein